jgi:hypothetical protein
MTSISDGKDRCPRFLFQCGIFGKSLSALKLKRSMDDDSCLDVTCINNGRTYLPTTTSDITAERERESKSEKVCV